MAKEDLLIYRIDGITGDRVLHFRIQFVSVTLIHRGNVPRTDAAHDSICTTCTVVHIVGF